LGALPIGRLGVLLQAPPDLAERPAEDRHASVALAGRSLGDPPPSPHISVVSWWPPACLNERRLYSAICCNFDRFLIGLGEMEVCRIRVEYRADKLSPEQRSIVIKHMNRSLKSDAANRRIDGRNGLFLQSGKRGRLAN
jgi:hypothetical protein